MLLLFLTSTEKDINLKSCIHPLTSRAHRSSGNLCILGCNIDTFKLANEAVAPFRSAEKITSVSSV